MSNERIEQILQVSELLPLNYSKYKAALKAMEQYGKEQYASGYLDSEKKNEVVQSCANSIADDNARLVKLAQAQKELIANASELLKEYIEEFDQDDFNTDYQANLHITAKNLIKKLES